MSWYEAQSYCRKSYTDLVSIRDQNQNEAVRTEGLNSSTSFWIGLLRDDWDWTDGGRSAYRNWATDQPRPSSDCAVMMNPTNVPPTVPDGLNVSEKKIAYMTEAQAPCITNDTDHIIVYSDDDNAELALKIESGKKSLAWALSRSVQG
ncbi:hypothetical protein AOLI_G00220940 [Acnodon oligacanthus]